jgi:HicB family
MATPSAAAEAEERTKPAPSGRLLLRMPAELHAELARAAERDGVSLNGFITKALSARIGWGDQPAEGPATSQDRRTRLVLAALLANAIVIGLAAAAAIAILVLALLG